MQILSHEIYQDFCRTMTVVDHPKRKRSSRSYWQVVKFGCEKEISHQYLNIRLDNWAYERNKKPRNSLEASNLLAIFSVSRKISPEKKSTKRNKNKRKKVEQMKIASGETETRQKFTRVRWPQNEGTNKERKDWKKNYFENQNLFSALKYFRKWNARE